ncbi:hypothetical protein JCM16303_005238 [Sporobolomyces ruberrimus]
MEVETAPQVASIGGVQPMQEVRDESMTKGSPVLPSLSEELEPGEIKESSNSFVQPVEPPSAATPRPPSLPERPTEFYQTPPHLRTREHKSNDNQGSFSSSEGSSFHPHPSLPARPAFDYSAVDPNLSTQPSLAPAQPGVVPSGAGASSSEGESSNEESQGIDTCYESLDIGQGTRHEQAEEDLMERDEDEGGATNESSLDSPETSRRTSGSSEAISSTTFGPTHPPVQPRAPSTQQQLFAHHQQAYQFHQYYQTPIPQPWSHPGVCNYPPPQQPQGSTPYPTAPPPHIPRRYPLPPIPADVAFSTNRTTQPEDVPPPPPVQSVPARSANGGSSLASSSPRVASLDIQVGPPQQPQQTQQTQQTQQVQAPASSGPKYTRPAKPANSYHIPLVTGVNPFVTKLRYMLKNPQEFSDVVCWSEDGQSVLVNFSDSRLVNEILPRVFNHSNPGAFARQFTVRRIFLLSRFFVCSNSETRTELHSHFPSTILSTFFVLLPLRYQNYGFVQLGGPALLRALELPSVEPPTPIASTSHQREGEEDEEEEEDEEQIPRDPQAWRAFEHRHTSQDLVSALKEEGSKKKKEEEEEEEDSEDEEDEDENWFTFETIDSLRFLKRLKPGNKKSQSGTGNGSKKRKAGPSTGGGGEASGSGETKQKKAKKSQTGGGNGAMPVASSSGTMNRGQQRYIGGVPFGPASR